MIKTITETIETVLLNYKSSTHVNTLIYSVKLYHDYTDKQIKSVIGVMLRSGKIAVVDGSYIILVKEEEK